MATYTLDTEQAIEDLVSNGCGRSLARSIVDIVKMSNADIAAKSDIQELELKVTNRMMYLVVGIAIVAIPVLVKLLDILFAG